MSDIPEVNPIARREAANTSWVQKRMVVIDRLSDGLFLVEASEPDPLTGVWETTEGPVVGATIEEAFTTAKAMMLGE